MKKDSKNDEYIYEALNYYNSEDIDVNGIKKVDEATSKRIKKLIDKKVKVNKTKYKGVKVAGIGIIAANIILVSASGVDVYANIGKGVIASFAKLTGDMEDYDKYSNGVNVSSTDKGIKFEVTEVVADGNKLGVSYSITSENSLNGEAKGIESILSPSLSINGKVFSGLSLDGQMINEHRYDGVVWTNDIDGIMPNSDFNLDIILRYIGELEGNWNLSVKVDGKKIKKEVKEYSINKKIELGDDSNFTINNIITSPLSIGVNATGSYGDYTYMLFDDKGNQLESRGTSTSEGKINMNYAGLISKDTKSLTFIPYKINEDFKPDFSEKYDLDKLPITIDQGKLGSITVNGAKWTEDGKLKISYEVNSKYPINASFGIDLLDENSKDLDADNFNNHQISKDDQKNFEKIYSGLDKNKAYKISHKKYNEYYLLDEDKAFTIELKK